MQCHRFASDSCVDSERQTSGVVELVQRVQCGKTFCVAYRDASACVHLCISVLDPTSLEFCFCLHFILSLSTFISMPPKYTRKQTESRDIDVGHEGGEESSFSEDTASAVSATSCITVTSDYLERILQANQPSMAALIAAMPAAPVPSSPSTCSPRVFL